MVPCLSTRSLFTMKGDGMGSSARRRDACFLVVINDDGLVAARRRRRVDVDRDRRCHGHHSSRSVFARRGPRFLRRRRRGGRLGLLSLAGVDGKVGLNGPRPGRYRHIGLPLAPGTSLGAAQGGGHPGSAVMGRRPAARGLPWVRVVSVWDVMVSVWRPLGGEK